MVALRQVVMIATLLMAGLVTPVSAQSVRAYVDRNPVAVDETVTLIVEQKGGAQDGEPDLSVLERDFDLLGTTQSSETRIVNGSTSSSRKWITTLAPKRVGEITIPAIAVGHERSAELVLRVRAARPSGSGAAKDILLEATIEPTEAYIQSQLVYTLRLFHAVSISQGSLEDPVIDHAIVERLGDDATFERVRDGRRYRVIERRYLIVPQASGQLVIPPVSFSGHVPQRRSRTSVFGDMFNGPGGLANSPFGGAFQTTRPVRVRSPERTIHVREVPAEFRGTAWLPARELSLTDTWSSDSTTLQLGDPVTRTVTIRARGLTGEQLPELSGDYPEIAKVYPDQADTATVFDGTWAVGTREQKFAVVPTQTGRLVLPEIKVRWWNIETDRAEAAVLPSRTFSVVDPAGAAATSHGDGRVGAGAPPRAQESSEAALRDGTSGSALDSGSAGERTAIPWSTAVLAVVWVATLGAWWYERRRARAPDVAAERHDTPLSSIKVERDRVRHACLYKGPREAREALLRWAAVQWRGVPHRNLGSVARRFSEGRSHPSTAEEAVRALDRALYAGESCHELGEWDGRRFWETIAQGMNKVDASDRVAPTESQQLPPLYLRSSI